MTEPGELAPPNFMAVPCSQPPQSAMTFFAVLLPSRGKKEERAKE